MYDDFDTQSVDDAAHRESNRDPRLVFYSKEPKEGAISLGENTIAMLPPFPHYEQRYADIYEAAKQAGARPKFPVGFFFRQMTIGLVNKRGGKTVRRSFRIGNTGETNHVIDAFRALHEARGFGKMDDELKKIADGMGGYADWRMAINVLLANSPDMVRVLNLSSNNPSDNDDARRKAALAWTEIVKHTIQLFPLCTEDNDGNITDLVKKPLLDPYQNIPLKTVLEYNGDIPQLGAPELKAKYESRGRTFTKAINVANVMRSAGHEFTEESLAYAEEFSAHVDDLPDLTDIKALIECGWACDLLGISSGSAAATKTQSSGFREELPPEARETKKEEAPKQEEKSAGTSEQGKAAETNGFSSFDANAAKAADEFKARLEAQAKAAKESNPPAEETAPPASRDAF